MATIALGGNGYVGLVNGDTWQEAVYTNFGEVGDKQQDQLEGALAQDFSRMMASKAQRRQLGRFGQQLVRQFFDAGQRIPGATLARLDATPAGTLHPGA